MFVDPAFANSLSHLKLTSAVVDVLRKVETRDELASIVQEVAAELGFRYYAVIHHADLSAPRPDLIDLKMYPAAITARLFSEQRYRRDPVMRGCIFADGAFLWSDLPRFCQLDRHDRASLEIGAREGLNEGITIPYVRLGHRLGSCTFAGTDRPELAPQMLGPAQMIGIFAFQAARRVFSVADPPRASGPRLHPRPRDCIILVGRGYSNKRIARALGLTPRTVDGYLTEARRLFEVHDRTELVVSAILAGEIGIDELMNRQPE